MAGYDLKHECTILAKIHDVREATAATIFGQERVIDLALITLLSGGHALLIGVPGLAKTSLVETLGTVLGLVVLSVGLWRTRRAPRWVPALVGAFILVEFVGSNLSSWAGQVASVLYLLAFAALARCIHATPAVSWETVRPAADETPALERV